MMILRVLLVMVCAFIFGKFVKIFKMPEILGWLLAGMMFGPYAFALIGDNILQNIYYVRILKIFETLLGIMIGSELIFSKLKKSGKQIVITTLWQSLSTFVVVTVSFSLIFLYLEIPLYLSLYFGGIALATAPAPSLAIVKEFNTKGPVTDTLIPMAALDDVVAIIVFMLVNSFIAAKYSSLDLSFPSAIFIMLVIPCLLGIPLGLISGKLTNRIKVSQYQNVFIIGNILLLVLVGTLLEVFILKSSMLNYTLIGMAYAATLANVMEEEKFIKAMCDLNPLIMFALMAVIINLGLPLNYKLILNAGVFTFIYILSRATGKYFGSYIGAKRTQLPETVQKYLGFTLLTHSGVSLVFTGMAVTTLSTFDSQSALIIQGTIAAAAILNEIIAVIIARYAFYLAGEIPEVGVLVDSN